MPLSGLKDHSKNFMKPKKKFVNLTPKSPEAKFYFYTQMNSFHGCEVKNETDEIFYLLSLNKQCTIQVNKTGNEHWIVQK